VEIAEDLAAQSGGVARNSVDLNVGAAVFVERHMFLNLVGTVADMSKKARVKEIRKIFKREELADNCRGKSPQNIATKRLACKILIPCDLAEASSGEGHVRGDLSQVDILNTSLIGGWKGRCHRGGNGVVEKSGINRRCFGIAEDFVSTFRDSVPFFWTSPELASWARMPAGAGSVDNGKDVSRFFTNRGPMQGSIQRVNVDLAEGMLDELGRPPGN
jgi:hypothetical protein